MIPIGYLSFRFIESPFFKYRIRYVIDPNQAQPDRSTTLARFFNGQGGSLSRKHVNVETSD
jgi:hypothetical protein